MIFLSVEPDQYYFIWQIELQLFNLTQLNIPKENIQVLIGYQPETGMSRPLKKFMEEFSDYRIYAYPDTRSDKIYDCTIRPHILQKHFRLFPELEPEAIFYMDSDIVFREMPDFSEMEKTGDWYASNTDYYMSAYRIIKALGYDVFVAMCEVVKIDPDVVLANEKHVGGAQYIIKNPPSWFWKKV